MTYSIIARCPRSGRFGVGSTTFSMACGRRNESVRPNVGVSKSQAFYLRYVDPLALNMLAQGYTPASIMRTLAAEDPDFDYRQFGIIDRDREQTAVDRMVKLLAIKAANLDIPVGALSGGNQQKVVIAKWLMIAPRIILLNDPTRGIDVGTKQEIYQLLRKLADDGATILFYSTDYDELIGYCDRVLVMNAGRIAAEFDKEHATAEAVGIAMTRSYAKEQAA